MKTISCAVIQDILPLYLDQMVSDKTKDIIEEHLDSCGTCREYLEKLKNELQNEPTEVPEPGKKDDEIRELQQFRKYLSGRTLRAVLLSVLCAAVILVGSAVYMNHQIRYISCADAGLTIMEESSEEVVLTDSVRGNYHWIYHLDTSTGISTVHFEQTLWERYVDCIFYPFDHEQVILKKDTIKEIYVDADGSQITIWEASDEEKERYFSSPRDNLG